MMKLKRLTAAILPRVLAAALSVSTAWGADTSTRSKRAVDGPKTSPALEAESALPVPEPQPAATVIAYGERDLASIKTKLRYTTLIVLPESERILDITCGDKEFWVVNGNENLAYVKPAKLGAETNLNILTASGNIYSFLLKEASERPGLLPDLKVFVELRDGGMTRAVNGPRAFVSAKEVDAYRLQLDAAHEEVNRVKETAQAEIDAGISAFITNMRFPYRYEAGRKPFNIRAMYHDDKFTYVQARPDEAPAIYEVKDGSPSLLNFDYENGVYVVRKVVRKGYFAIGKQKLQFTSEE